MIITFDIGYKESSGVMVKGAVGNFSATLTSAKQKYDIDPKNVKNL